MTQSATPPLHFECPSPLRVAGILRDTGDIFRQTAPKPAYDGLTADIVQISWDETRSVLSIRTLKHRPGAVSGILSWLFSAPYRQDLFAHHE